MWAPELKRYKCRAATQGRPYEIQDKGGPPIWCALL